MKILGIETSCDETAAAVVSYDPAFGEKKIISNVIYSQITEHAPYGGVVPEIASRAHITHIDRVINEAMIGLEYSDLDAIAATSGPGLIGGVIVGMMTGKAIASVINKPFIAINHLEGHALTARLTDNVEFPYLLLLVSGGHCQIVIAQGVGKYKTIGSTIDDAIGESFDKVAKMLGLDYPGGPIVEKYALEGDPNKFNFPKPLLTRNDCDFSFSGLKTAVFREIIRKEDSQSEPLSQQYKADICASFQRTCGDILVNKVSRAIGLFKDTHGGNKAIVVAGGVAANKYLCARLRELSSDNEMSFIAPPLTLCTDNAAMIAWAGAEHYDSGMKSQLDIAPRARWPLEAL